MANKMKPVKGKTVDPGQLRQEKEETVEVKQLLKDERTHKIAGSICLLLAVLFLLHLLLICLPGARTRISSVTAVCWPMI